MPIGGDGPWDKARLRQASAMNFILVSLQMRVDSSCGC